MGITPLKNKCNRFSKHLSDTYGMGDISPIPKTVKDFVKLKHITKRMEERNITDAKINTILMFGKKYYFFRKNDLGIKYVHKDYILISVEKWLLTVIRTTSDHKMNKLKYRDCDGFLFEELM